MKDLEDELARLKALPQQPVRNTDPVSPASTGDNSDVMGALEELKAKLNKDIGDIRENLDRHDQEIDEIRKQRIPRKSVGR